MRKLLLLPLLISLFNYALAKEVLVAHIAPFTTNGNFFKSSNQSLTKQAVAESIGMKLALSEWKNRKVLIDGEEIQFMLREFDDQANANIAKIRAKKVIDEGAVAVIGHFNSGTSIAAAPIYRAANVPHITLGATNPHLTRQGWHTSFRLLGNDDQIGFELAKLFELEKGSVLYVRDDSGYADAFEGGFLRWKNSTKSGKKIISANELNFQTILKNDKTISRVLVVGEFGISESVIKHVGAEFPFMKITGGDFICSTDFYDQRINLKLNNEILCAITGDLDFDRSDKFKVFIDKLNDFGGYELKQEFVYKDYEIILISAQAYDAVNIIINAMIKANSLNTDKWMNVMRETKFSGVSQEIQFDAKGDLLNPVFTLFKRSDNNSFEQVRTFPSNP